MTLNQKNIRVFFTHGFSYGSQTGSKKGFLWLFLFWALILLLGSLWPGANMPEAYAKQQFAPNSPEGTTEARFVHMTTAQNINGNQTTLSHPLIDNDPEAVIQVSAHLNANGVDAVFNDHVTGVFYNHFTGLWSIVNQDGADMPLGAAFNLFIRKNHPDAFVHTAAASDTIGIGTIISHPDINNNPDAIIHITPNLNPETPTGTFFDHPVGVHYQADFGWWFIFTEDNAAMEQGATFNIFVAKDTPASFIHTTNSAAIWTVLDHPSLNNNPDAIVLVTRRITNGSGAAVYNNNNVGVSYNHTFNEWQIVNQSTNNLPDGVSFNITSFEPGTMYQLYLPAINAN